MLEAYVPNRKWSKDREEWLYYAHTLHAHEQGRSAIVATLETIVLTIARTPMGQRTIHSKGATIG